MKRTFFKIGLSLMFFVLSSFIASQSVLAQKYTITDLGTLGSGRASFASAINNSGQVVGYSGTDNVYGNAFLYSGGQMTDLGTLGGILSVASGINNNGQVVGHSRIADGTWHSFLYSGGQMTDLISLIAPNSGWTIDNASGINDRGQIVGSGHNLGSPIGSWDHAFLMTPVIKPVSIDIEPFFKPNIIDRQFKWAPIPVAILSKPGFDAPKMIEEDSLTFGDEGNENSLAFCSPLFIDVNGDRLRDLMCFFYTGKAGFQCGDTEGILKGKTKDGTPIEGSDSVKIVPCR